MPLTERDHGGSPGSLERVTYILDVVWHGILIVAVLVLVLGALLGGNTAAQVSMLFLVMKYGMSTLRDR